MLAGVLVVAMALALVSATPPPRTAQQGSRGTLAPALPKEYDPLIACVGEWDLTSRVWLQPGMGPIEGAGRSTIRRAFGGYFIEERTRLTLAGTLVETASITGWNGSTGAYESTRFASTTPVAMRDSGSFDAERREFSFSGAYELAGIPTRQHSTLRLVSADTMALVVNIAFGDAPEFKGAEILYRRRK